MAAVFVHDFREVRRESGNRENAGRVERRALATMSSEGGIAGIMVRS
jgi:hypothetical protein